MNAFCKIDMIKQTNKQTMLFIQQMNTALQFNVPISGLIKIKVIKLDNFIFIGPNYVKLICAIQIIIIKTVITRKRQKICSPGQSWPSKNQNRCHRSAQVWHLL